MSDRIFKDSEGTPANYGDTVELIKDKLGNDRLGPDKSNETAPYSYAGPIPELEDGGYVIQRMEDGNTNNYIDVAVTGWYQVKFRVEADSTLPGNTISFRDGSSTIAGSVYPGDHTFLHNFTGSIRWQGRIGNSAKVTVLSVRELPGNHVIQSSASLKPVLGRVPVGGRRNLLPVSEDLTQWFNSGGEVTVSKGIDDPFGGNSAYRLMPIPGNNFFRLTDFAIQYPVIGEADTWGVYVRLVTVGANNIVQLYFPGVNSSERIENQLVQDQWVFVELSQVATSDSSNVVQIRIGNEGTVIDVCRPQYEKGGASTPYQRVTSDLDVYEEGQQHIEYLRFDGIDDCMTQTFPDGFEGDLIVCGTKGSWVDENVSIPPGGELTIGPIGLPNTPNILPALGDIIGWVPVSRTTTEEERQRIIEYYKGRGAKGRLVPSGVELVTNGTFDSDLSGWSSVNNEWVWNDGAAVITAAQSSTAYLIHSAIVEKGKTYQLTISLLSTDAPIEARFGSSAPAQSVIRFAAPGEHKAILPWLGDGSTLFIRNASAGGSATIDNISIQELIPEEDLS